MHIQAFENSNAHQETHSKQVESGIRHMQDAKMTKHRVAHLDSLAQKPPALCALVEPKDCLVHVVVGDVAGGDGGGSVNLQPR